NHDLTGRTALVTGAGVGIGQAVALALAACGVRVGVHYHTSAQGAEESLARITGAGGDGVLLPGDLASESAAHAVVDRLVEHFGGLDILVNNAGSPLSRSRIEDCPTDLWRQAFAVNVDSAFFVTRRAIPHLRASGRGAIVNNLSLSVQTGGAGGAGPYPPPQGAPEGSAPTPAEGLAPARAGHPGLPRRL